MKNKKTLLEIKNCKLFWEKNALQNVCIIAFLLANTSLTLSAIMAEIPTLAANRDKTREIKVISVEMNTTKTKISQEQCVKKEKYRTYKFNYMNHLLLTVLDAIWRIVGVKLLITTVLWLVRINE